MLQGTYPRTLYVFIKSYLTIFASYLYEVNCTVPNSHNDDFNSNNDQVRGCKITDQNKGWLHPARASNHAEEITHYMRRTGGGFRKFLIGGGMGTPKAFPCHLILIWNE